MVVCFPHRPGSGGPGSFQRRFEEELSKYGWQVIYRDSENKLQPDLIFVVGGTRHIGWLVKMKLKRVPVLFRLDGISWLHRKKKIGLKKFLKAEFGNLNNKIIHAFIANTVVYQSDFVKKWWDREGFRIRNNTSIIYNGVALAQKSKISNGEINNRLVILEGNIDYSPYSIRLINDLSVKLQDIINIELYGNFEFNDSTKKLSNLVRYYGYIQLEKVYEVMSGSIYLSLDINPACPNTVIEALSCGAPVVAFDTGSLKELVPAGAGIIVPYGSDPWQLGYPDADALAEAIIQITGNYRFYSENARKVANDKYSIDCMTQQYYILMEHLIKKS